MTGLTRRLARFAAETVRGALPEAVAHEGVRSFANWVGCCFGGSGEASVGIAVGALDEFSGPRQASVLGRGVRLDIFHAAFANALASSVHSFNDTHFTSVAHPTSPVAAALFALAERRPIAGADFVHALVLGNEVQCRIGNVLTVPPARCNVALSTAGLLGGIGAAVAVGRAIGLDEERMAWAIGIAAAAAGGVRETHATMSSHFIPAHASRDGLSAAVLAEKGFTSTDKALEGPKGFAAAFAERPNFEAGLDRLGESYEVLTIAYKPYPCGFVIHPIIDACLDLAKDGAVEPGRIERLELRVNPLAVQLTDRVEPGDRHNALVSLQHWAAVALLRGRAGIPEGSMECVGDPAVRALRHRIAATADPAIAREEAAARLVFRDGRVAETHVRHCRGSIGRPMTDDELAGKFLAQACLALPRQRAEEALDRCWRVASMDDVGALGEVFRGGEPDR